MVYTVLYCVLLATPTSSGLSHYFHKFESSRNKILQPDGTTFETPSHVNVRSVFFQIIQVDYGLQENKKCVQIKQHNY